MKNSPLKILLLVLTVVLILLPLQWLPKIQIGSYEVKRIALLSDILPDEDSAALASDTTLLPPPPPPPTVENKQKEQDKLTPKGMICIEDYADETNRGMQPLYKALANLHNMNRPVRIAYFGDSFIEVDILTAPLRNLFQQKFGGSGVGFLDMAPPYAANRTTVHQRYGGWNSMCILDKGKYTRDHLNIGQRYFTPKETAWTEIAGIKQPRLDTTEVHTLYLRSNEPIQVGVKLNQDPMLALQTQGNGKVEAITRIGKSGRTRWQIPSANNLICWGVAEESHQGVIIDNLSLRGSSGASIAEIPLENLNELNAVRPYDLIVLQFGLNVANKKQMNYTSYTTQMSRVVKHLKKSFPQAGILIIGVGDRADRLSDGELHTIPGIPALSRYQQHMAAENNVAFWSMFEGMGGDGSMLKMAHAKPAQAGKDYTHINARGGKHLADILFKTIMYGYEQYAR